MNCQNQFAKDAHISRIIMKINISKKAIEHYLSADLGRFEWKYLQADLDGDVLGDVCDPDIDEDLAVNEQVPITVLLLQ